jgi:hypothetical protein
MPIAPSLTLNGSLSMNAELFPEGHAIVGAYVGPQDEGTFSRTVDRCEHFWNEEFPVGTFDSMIHRQLEHAKFEQRNTVVVLDIGSGSANLFRDFVTRRVSESKTHQFLKQNPSISIQFIGITDARTPANFFQTEYSNQNIPQIQIKNVAYTLSYQQTMNAFLQRFSIEHVDLCVSTFALTYVGQNVFKQVLHVLSHLSKAGEVMISNYSDLKYFPGVVNGALAIKKYDATKASLKITLSKKGLRLSIITEDAYPDEECSLNRAEELFVRVGVLSLNDLHEIRNTFQEQKHDIGYKEALHKRMLALYDFERTLISRKAEHIHNQKQEIINTIADEYRGVFSVRHGTHTLSIRLP